MDYSDEIRLIKMIEMSKIKYLSRFSRIKLNTTKQINEGEVMKRIIIKDSWYDKIWDKRYEIIIFTLIIIMLMISIFAK